MSFISIIVFEKNNFEKRSKGLKVIKNHLSGNFFRFPFRLSHGHLKHIESEKLTNFSVTEKYNRSLKRSWKLLFNGNIFGNVDWNYYHLKPETNLKHGIRQWKIFNNDDVIYIVAEVLKNAIQW